MVKIHPNFAFQKVSQRRCKHFFLLVYVHAHVDAQVCAAVCAVSCVHMRVWRPEINLGVILQVLCTTDPPLSVSV